MDEETKRLLAKIYELWECENEPTKLDVYNKLERYIASGAYKKRYITGATMGLNDEELKEVLRYLMAPYIYRQRNLVFYIRCPRCNSLWKQGPREEEEEDYITCPVCYNRITNPAILNAIPYKGNLPESLDELTEEQKRIMPDKVKEMIAFNEGFRYGMVFGKFCERERWLEHYFPPPKQQKSLMKMVEVPASEQEIIQRLKKEKGINEDEVLVAVPKMTSIKNSEELFVAIMFCLSEENPLTQEQLSKILNVTQSRISQILSKYKGKLIRTTRIEAPYPSKRRRILKAYYMPRKVRKKLAEKLFNSTEIYREISGIAQHYPKLKWQFKSKQKF